MAVSRADAAGVSADTVASVAAPRTQTSTADAARDAALVQWQRSLAAALADSARARDQLVLAQLHRHEARRFERVGDRQAAARAATAADAALRRALALGADDPIVWWSAATDCPAAPPVCDAPRAVERLRELAPSNAAVWVLPRLPRAAGASAVKRTEDDVRLARIAAASRYDSYFGERARAYNEAFAAAPVPPALLEAAWDVGPRAEPAMLRAIVAFGLLLAEVAREVEGYGELCGEAAVAALGATRADACRAALDRVLDRADTQLAYQAAMRERLALARDDAERAGLEAARSTLEWQAAALQELTADPGAPAARDHMQRLLGPGATELGAGRDLLRAHGIAPAPPPDWHRRRSITPPRHPTP